MSGEPADPDPVITVELAKRLLNHGPGWTSVELVVGGLPEGLADQVPLPSGARLLVSLLRSRGARPLHLEAVLDAPGDPTQVVTTFRNELHGRGWDTVEGGHGPMQGGFVEGPTTEALMLRRAGQGPNLMVSASAQQAKPVDLRVHLDWQMPRHLDASGGRLGYPPGAERMPTLTPPSGVALERQSGGGGGDRWHSAAVIHTDRPVADLEGHFAAQLAAAGWGRMDGRGDDVAGWSSWRLPGDDGWRGLLLVLAPFGQRQRSLWLSIEATETDDDESGGFRSHVSYQPE